MAPAKQKTKPDQPTVDELSYEQALAELDTIVTSLEANKLSLDDSMALFERGQALIQHCVGLLDKAELRIKRISGDSLMDVSIED